MKKHTFFMNDTWKEIETFKELYFTHYNPLVNFVNSRFVKDRDDAKDIVQNCFLKLWQKREEINISTSFKNYIFQIARNASLDFINKHSKTHLTDADELREIEDIEEGDLSEYELIQIRTEIKEALKVLKPRTRQIFEMSKIEGLTYQEIADSLDISKRTVEDNMARALVLLKDEIKRLRKQRI